MHYGHTENEPLKEASERVSELQGTSVLLRNPTQQKSAAEQRDVTRTKNPQTTKPTKKPRTETVICNIIPATLFNAYC